MANDAARHETLHTEGSMPIKHWTRGVPMEDAARAQLHNMARLPFIHKWLAVMPDVHLGKGATSPSKRSWRRRTTWSRSCTLCVRWSA